MATQLIKELQELCDEKGKEKNPGKSAPIFHQLGLIFKDKSPDKRCLIRSAALLNAAIVRQPNEEYVKSLHKLCSHVLRLVEVSKLNADLVELSEKVVVMLKHMRKETEENLKQLKKIPYDINKLQLHKLEEEKIKNVQSLQHDITQKYLEILRFISSECEAVMGGPPCKYVIIGMGSLARCEITPYSDFEHAIILEDVVQTQEESIKDRALEYFRWYSLIFHIIVLNLKETILPCVAVPGLNDATEPGVYGWFFDAVTPRGVSFDGFIPNACKFPLGRPKTKQKPWETELIKRLSDMLRYLTPEENKKNGYHLAVTLMRTSFVYGDNTLYDKFLEGIENMKQSEDRLSFVDQQLESDLKKYDILKTLSGSPLAIKGTIKVIYFSICLCIAGLGRYYSLNEGSSFSLVDRLKKKGAIDDETAHRLSYALAITCEIRLKAYASKQCQDNYFNEENLKRELNAHIGEKSMIDFFIIVYCLQVKLGKQGNLSDLEFPLQLKPNITSKFKILLLLKLYERLLSEWNELVKDKSLPWLLERNDELEIQCYVADSYYSCQSYDKALKMWEHLSQQSKTDPDLLASSLVGMGKCLHKLGRFHDGIKLIDEAMQEVSNLPLTQHGKKCIEDLVSINRLCKKGLGSLDGT